MTREALVEGEWKMQGALVRGSGGCEVHWVI